LKESERLSHDYRLLPRQEGPMTGYARIQSFNFGYQVNITEHWIKCGIIEEMSGGIFSFL
jgi:hypothetical protein